MDPPASLRVMAVETEELMRRGIEAALPLIPAGIQPFIAKTAEDALKFFLSVVGVLCSGHEPAGW